MKYKSTQLLFQFVVLIGCECTVELDQNGKLACIKVIGDPLTINKPAAVGQTVTGLRPYMYSLQKVGFASFFFF